MSKQPGIPKAEAEELMRHLDGELSLKEARALERRLAASPEAAAVAEVFRESLDQSGKIVRARYEAATDEAEPKFDALWHRLERQLGQPERAPAKPGFLAGLRDWIDTYRSHLLTGTICAAAGALIAIFSTATPATPQPRVVERVVEKEKPVYVYNAPVFSNDVIKPQTADIESLEVTNGSGTIFRIPGDGADDAATTVIWITPDEGSGTEGPI